MNFLDTMAGRKLTESDIPRGIKALERIAEALERLVNQKEQDANGTLPIVDIANLMNFIKDQRND